MCSIFRKRHTLQIISRGSGGLKIVRSSVKSRAGVDIEALTPIVNDCDRHAEATVELANLVTAREALRVAYRSKRLPDLLSRALADNSIAAFHAPLRDCRAALGV